MKLNFFFITIILFLNSCGYTPMYSSVNKTDFYLEKINLNGDEFIIKNITNNLSNFSQKQTVRKRLLLREKFYTKKLLRQKT